MTLQRRFLQNLGNINLVTEPCLDNLLNWSDDAFLHTDRKWYLNDSISGNNLLVKSPILYFNGVDNVVNSLNVTTTDVNQVVDLTIKWIPFGTPSSARYAIRVFDPATSQNYAFGWFQSKALFQYTDAGNIQPNQNLVAGDIVRWVFNVSAKTLSIFINNTEYSYTNIYTTPYTNSKNFSLGGSDNDGNGIADTKSEFYLLKLSITSGTNNFCIVPENSGSTITNLYTGTEYPIVGTQANVHQKTEYQVPLFTQNVYVFTDNSAPTDYTKNRYIVADNISIPTITGYTYSKTVVGSNILKETGSTFNYPSDAGLIAGDVSEKLYSSSIPRNLYYSDILQLDTNIFVKESTGEILFYDENNPPSGICLSQTQNYSSQ